LFCCTKLWTPPSSSIVPGVRPARVATFFAMSATVEFWYVSERRLRLRAWEWS
jgi:hypothetical protein